MCPEMQQICIPRNVFYRNPFEKRFFLHQYTMHDNPAIRFSDNLQEQKHSQLGNCQIYLYYQDLPCSVALSLLSPH